MATKKMPGGGQGKKIGKMTASGSGITGARIKVTGTAKKAGGMIPKNASPLSSISKNLASKAKKK